MATPFPFSSGQTLTAAQMNAVTTLPVSTKTVSYTAVVGDVGSRIVMNVASANTVTINNSIFAEGDTIFIANKGAGLTTVTAGVGVTINTSGSLDLAQYGGGTLVALSASTFTFFPAGGSSKIVQIVTGTTSTQVSSSVTTFADTGLTATITPTSASNKILVVVTQNGGVKTAGSVDNAISIKLLRGATDIQTFGISVGYTNSLLSLYLSSISTQYLDSPNTTSATTYKTQFANGVAAAAVRLQEGSLVTSTIVLYEVIP